MNAPHGDLEATLHLFFPRGVAIKGTNVVVVVVVIVVDFVVVIVIVLITIVDI